MSEFYNFAGKEALIS